MEQELIGQRLAQARGDESQSSFAAKMGVHRNSLARYEQGETQLRGDLLHQLWKQGIDPAWILTGEGEMRRSNTSKSALRTALDVETDFIRVKRYRLRLAAGAGQIGDENEEVDWLSFRRQYLEFIGLSAKNAAIVRIKGDSMEPMMIDGDTVMIDLSDTTIGPPSRNSDRRRAYAIKRIQGESALLQCKFVELVREDGTEFTQVSSFNEFYTPERLIQGKDFEVLGRVRWHGHTWF